MSKNAVIGKLVFGESIFVSYAFKLETWDFFLEDMFK